MADKNAAGAPKKDGLTAQAFEQASVQGESIQIVKQEAAANPFPQLLSSLPVQAIMSSPVRTVQADVSLADAQAVFLRYGHSGLCVLNSSAQLVGMLSRRDVDVALRHGLRDASVLTCMSAPVKAIAPQSSISEAYQLMATYDIGRLPVVGSDCLVGIITRSDLLGQLRLTPAQATPPKLTPPNSTLQSSDPTPTPSSDQLFQQFKARSGLLWPILEQLIKQADDNGWALYVVGGAVRDLLLSYVGQSQPLVDIDLVVDGAQAGAGAELAASVQSAYPQVELRIYGEFQTAALTWSPQDIDPSQEDIYQDQDRNRALHHQSSPPSCLPTSVLEIDIATARTEFYPYPAANPEVEASTIHQDLYRRDFTINAMALRLNNMSGNGVARGQLLDFFGGWLDLQRRHIRVIHPNSFIEDPTRIFRALRFAVRLGFDLDPYTRRLVGYAVRTSLYVQVKAQHQKVPALQSRLTAELEKILSTNHWLESLEALNRLGALSCLHPNLQMTSELRSQLCRMAKWQRRFLPKVSRWRLLLVLLLAYLLPAERVHAATTLNLDAQSQYQLENLHQWERDLTTQLSDANKPSEIYECLHSYNRVEQLLIVSRNPYTLGPQIWHYIIHLSRMSPLINGATLKRLGYPPGPQYRAILTVIHQLTLDGVLNSTKAAESYIIAHYPLPRDA